MAKKVIIGVTIGIIAAILWSVVFINSLNSMAGIGIGICLGISFGISGSLIFSKKIKISDDTTSRLSMVVYRDSVISHRPKKIHNPQESGLDAGLEV